MTSGPDSLLATRVETARLTVNVLHTDRSTGTPVVFVHGNLSSSAFFAPTMQALPDGWRPYAVDLRAFGDTDPLPINASRGMRDWSADLVATIEALELSAVHLVGWSMGGGVVLQLLLDRPDLVSSLSLIAPVSPYGFGGTTDAAGTRIDDEGSCSGAGGANPEFVRLLAEGDRSDGPMSPRTIMRSFYVAPGWPGDDEELFLDSMLSTRVGEDHYPGDARTSDAWPGVRPGDRGVLNTMAPHHFDVSSIVDSEHKPPILWIRGELDLVVRSVDVRPRPARRAGRDPGLAWGRHASTATDVGPDEAGPGDLRAAWRHLSRGGHARGRTQPARRTSGGVPGGSARAPGFGRGLKFAADPRPRPLVWLQWVALGSRLAPSRTRPPAAARWGRALISWRAGWR